MKQYCYYSVTGTNSPTVGRTVDSVTGGQQ